MYAMTIQRKSKKRPVLYWSIFGVTLWALFHYNPPSYFWEAGAHAYYQARIAYERGDDSARHRLLEAANDGRITLHEYSAIVFPAYLHTVKDSETVFPRTEMEKGFDTVKREALAVIKAGAKKQNAKID